MGFAFLKIECCFDSSKMQKSVFVLGREQNYGLTRMSTRETFWVDENDIYIYIDYDARNRWGQ